MTLLEELKESIEEMYFDFYLNNKDNKFIRAEKIKYNFRIHGGELIFSIHLLNKDNNWILDFDGYMFKNDSEPAKIVNKDINFFNGKEIILDQGPETEIESLRMMLKL